MHRSWQSTELARIVVARGGIQTGPFGSQLRASDYVAQGVPVLMPRDLAGNRICSSRAARVLPETAAQLERYRLLPDDIIIARRGKIGRCARVSADASGWLCGTGCLRMRLGKSVDPGFFIQYLQWPMTIAWLRDNAVGQTMENLSTKILRGLPVSLPPLAEQRRIAEILGSVDAYISSSQQVIDQTATVKEGLLRLLLTPGGNRADGGLTMGEAAMPPGWKLRPIGELCSFTNGHGFKAAEWASGGLPIIRIKNLNGSREFKYFSGEPKKSWMVDAGELLFAWAGVKGVSFGPHIWTGPSGVLNQHIYRVRPHKGVAKAWLFEILRQVTRRIEERAQGFKSSLLHVCKADVAGQLVPVPPRAKQRVIAERSAFFTEMQKIEQANLEGQINLKHALMGDLFSGRVSTASMRARPASSAPAA